MAFIETAQKVLKKKLLFIRLFQNYSIKKLLSLSLSLALYVSKSINQIALIYFSSDSSNSLEEEK